MNFRDEIMKMNIVNVAVMLLLLIRCYTLWDTVSEVHCSDAYWRIFLTTGTCQLLLQILFLFAYTAYYVQKLAKSVRRHTKI